MRWCWGLLHVRAQLLLNPNVNEFLKTFYNAKYRFILLQLQLNVQNTLANRHHRTTHMLMSKSKMSKQQHKQSRVQSQCGIKTFFCEYYFECLFLVLGLFLGLFCLSYTNGISWIIEREFNPGLEWMWPLSSVEVALSHCHIHASPGQKYL
jgi:hypothetical protein